MNKEKIETKSVKELEEIMGDAYTTDSVKVAFKEGYNTAKREDKTLRQEWEREAVEGFIESLRQEEERLNIETEYEDGFLTCAWETDDLERLMETYLQQEKEKE